MISFIDFVFFVYMFVALYITSVFLILYWHNKNNIHLIYRAKPVPVSIIIPCFNDADHLSETINSIYSLDYPKNMFEVIVVDDKSTDNSVELLKRYSKKNTNFRYFINKRNSGGAAEPTNIGIKNSKYNYIAIVDSDSSPSKDSLIKMVGVMQNESNVGCVTCSILSKKPKSFVQEMQELEYIGIAFTRRLLDFVDSVYVAPGPLALYKKEVFDRVGYFDKQNLTQDIEMTWRLLKNGYYVRMCLPARVYSATPETILGWIKQRIRWNIGGIQTLLKYKKLFLQKGMLGTFIIPLFTLSMFLGFFGLILFFYLFIKRVLVSYLITKYSFVGGVELINLQDLTFTPSIINFFSFALFFLGLWFVLFGVYVMNKTGEKTKHNVFKVLLYFIFYLAAFPLLFFVALCKLAKGNYKW